VLAPNSGFVAVAAGGYHSLGRKSDGTVVAWGRNDYGQCDVPAPNSGFVAVSGGDCHSLGLKSDGTVVAWGRNDYGQCEVPAPNSGFVAVAAGGYHSLGLRGLVTAVAFGDLVIEVGRDHVDLHWSVVLDSPARLFVLRAAAEDGAYESIRGPLEAGAGRSEFAYRDPSVGASTEYYYKIGCEEAGAWSYSSRVHAATPGSSLAFLGISPNPSPGGMTVDLVLAPAGRAQLEVLDVRGRRVLWQNLSGLRPGRHVLEVAAERRLAAGVYVVRLSQAGRVRTAKVTVLR
jgi:hypothetical protein